MTDIEAQRAREAARRREQERQRQERDAAQRRERERQQVALTAQRAGERNPVTSTGDIEAIRAIEATRRRERERQRALQTALEAQRRGERDLRSNSGSSGSVGATGGVAGAYGESDDAPSPQDARESNDRLRKLNEEEDAREEPEDVRPFNLNEFFGDNFDLGDIGDSVRESGEWFVRFVQGQVDSDVPLFNQIKRLFNEAHDRLDALFEPLPVDENWSNLTSERLVSYFGPDWMEEWIFDADNEAEDLITLVESLAQGHYGINLSLEGASAEEAVDMYVEALEQRMFQVVAARDDMDRDEMRGLLTALANGYVDPEEQEEWIEGILTSVFDTNWGVETSDLLHMSTDDIMRDHAFWLEIQNTFGARQDTTMDVSEFAIQELGLAQTTTPAQADAAVDALIQGYIDSGLIDPEAVEGMTREQIAYLYHQATLVELESVTQQRAEFLNPPTTAEPTFGGGTVEELLQSQENWMFESRIDELERDLRQSRNLVLAFNRMYEPPQTPWGELLLFVLSFTPLDQYVSGFDLGRSIASGDWLGAAISALDFVIPGRLRSAVDAINGQGDELVEGGGRLANDVDVIDLATTPVTTSVVDVVQGRFFGGRSNQTEIADDIARGFGTLTGQSKGVTREGIDAIIDHLTNSPYLNDAMKVDYNQAMIQRLENALANGHQISGADLSFYLHEQAEAVFMARLTRDNPTLGELLDSSGYSIEDLLPYGLGEYDRDTLEAMRITELPSDDKVELRTTVFYQYAHQAALDLYGVSHFSLYPEEVVRASNNFNPRWYDEFWQEFPSGN